MAMGRSRGVIMNRDKKIREVEIHGKHVQGKNEYLKFLRGEQITRREAMLAKCYECTCYYDDTERDCLIPDCPMYPYHPYANAKAKEQAKKRKISEEQKQKLRERLKVMRERKK